MDLNAQALYSETSYAKFLPADFIELSQPGAKNFAKQKLLKATQETPTADSFVEEAWVPITAFLETMQEAVSGVDEYLCVKYWNAPMARLTGVPREEALHQPLFSLLPDDFERHLEAGLRHLFKQRASNHDENAETVEGEFAQSHGNSEFFDFSYRMQVLPTNGNRGLAIITLRLVREGRSRQRRHKPSEPFGLLGQLSAGIAQELTEPLNTICSRIDNIIAFAGDRWSEDLEGELHSIITEVYRISYLVNNILTLSSHEATNAVPIDLCHLIPEAITLLEHTLNRQIACVTALQEDLPPVTGDPILLQSVLQNILRYAVEAAGEDAVPRIQANLLMQPAVNGREVSRQLVIRIEDRGATMAAPILAQLFEPVPCSKQFGIAVGLGLFISKKIIESHGGQIHVGSEPGHGTIFTMTLKV